MKIIVAPDKFKHCMSSLKAGEIIAETFQRQIPHADIHLHPMSDGGDGFLEFYANFEAGQWLGTRVSGPLLNHDVPCTLFLPHDGKTAVIETAKACGLTHLTPTRETALASTSYGVGELIRKALSFGRTHIILGLGGSACTDGGTGMANALGIRFLDSHGHELPPGGKELNQLQSIDMTQAIPEIHTVKFTAYTDVNATLLGSTGTARLFSPQKGAGSMETESLESGMTKLFQKATEQKLFDGTDKHGYGSAGGLAFGLSLFCNAEIRGIETLWNRFHFDKIFEGTSLLVTGEGCTDEQTFTGKLCMKLSSFAKPFHAKTMLLSGKITASAESVSQYFDYAYSITPENQTDYLEKAEENLKRTTSSAISTIQKEINHDEFKSQNSK